MDVYVDLLFLINFCMDFVCLYVSSRAMSIEAKAVRLCVAASVGGIYSIVALFTPAGWLNTLASILLCPVICLIAFTRSGDSRLRLIKISTVYIVVNALLGGLVSVSFTFLEGLFSHLREEAPDASATLPRGVYFSLAAGCLLSLFVVKGMKKIKIDKADRVRIVAFENEIVLGIVSDSGNRLRDPIRCKPCVVISRKALSRLSGEEKALLIAEGMITEEVGERVCVIPTATVNASSLMFGFYPRRAELIDSSGRYIKSIDIAVGVSCEDSLDENVAILPSELI